MAELNQFIPGAGSSGGQGYDPEIAAMNYMNSWIWASSSTGVRILVSGLTYQTAQAFWNIVDTYGSYAEVTTVDTWTTIADATGRGILGGIVTPINTTSTVYSIRVTVDGTEYLIDSVSGGYSVAIGIICGTTDASISESYRFPASPAIHLIPPIPTISSNASISPTMLPFKESIKVEVKASALNATQIKRFSGAMYELL